MKKDTSNRIRLGVFVSIGAALLVTVIYLIGDRQQMFNTTFRVSGIFKDVSGLKIGNNVRFSGIKVGTIEAIEIMTDTTVKVDMIIDESTQKYIKKDAKVIIGSEGLMGNKVLIITPGTKGHKMIENNDYVQATVPVSLDDIMVSFKSTVDNANEITEDLAVVMHSIRSGEGTIGRLLMDSSLAKNIDQTIVNLKHGTKNLDANMEAAKSSFLLRGAFKKQKKAKEKEEEEKKKAK